MGEDRKLYEGKPEGKRPLGRPRLRWDVIGMDLGEMGWEGVERIHVAQDRNRWRAVVNTVKNLRILTPHISLVSGGYILGLV
jgi:hypothetical protein